MKKRKAFLFQKTFHSAFLDGFERDSIDSRCAVVLLAIL